MNAKIKNDTIVIEKVPYNNKENIIYSFNVYVSLRGDYKYGRKLFYYTWFFWDPIFQLV